MVNISHNIQFIFCLLLFSIIGELSYAQTIAFNTENVEYYIQNRKIGLRDVSTKKIVVPCKYDYIGTYSSTHKLAPFKKSGLWGYLNDKAVETIKPKYEEARAFSTKHGLAPVKLNGKWGFINKSGILKLACKYEDVGGFNDEGLARIKLDGKWGIINTAGTVVIPCKYDDLNNLSKQGFATASLNKLYGTIDKTGKILVPFKYESSLYFNDEGYAVCKRYGKYGIVDRNGNETTKCIYVATGSLSEGLLCVQANEKWGFIDYMGNVIIPVVYKYKMDFLNGIVGMDDSDGGSYILSKDTRRIAAFPKCSFITRLGYYDDGTLFVVHESDGDGLVNSEGKYILPATFKDVEIFHGFNLVGVKKTDKWGFANIDGTIQIPYSYDEIGYHFQNGHIACKKSDKWGIIDTHGNNLIPFAYDLIEQNGMFSRTKNGDKWGAIGPDAKVVFEPKYDEVGYPTTSLRYYPVKLNGQDGYADYYGNDTF